MIDSMAFASSKNLELSLFDQNFFQQIFSWLNFHLVSREQRPPTEVNKHDSSYCTRRFNDSGN